MQAGREIKFRGKRSDNGEWVYGNLMLTAYGCYIIPQNIYADRMPQFSVDPGTVAQFTGIRDKNGKEIYEGDIVSDEGGKNAAIEWIQDLAQFLVMYEEETQEIGSWCEVIGNIYEDPELLPVI